MVRSSRPSAGTTTRTSHASHSPCKHHFLVFAWNARRAIHEPLWQQTVESTACRHGGSQIARARTPCEK
eukprot:5019004-Lingulodinium_polyedra.AAC.1